MLSKIRCGTCLFQIPNCQNSTRESVFLERRSHIAEICKTHGNFTDALYEYYSETPTVIAGENKSFVFCGVAKAGSSFWKHVLSLMENGKDYSSLFTWYKQLPRLQDYQSSHTLLEKQAFLESATNFMFVREPYERLFSAYIDKLFRPNILFWRGTGWKVVKMLRTNVTGDHASDLGYDVKFAELIKFLVLKFKSDRQINEHFAPMYSRCNPCGQNNIYVGELETFTADSKYIISKIDKTFDHTRLLLRHAALNAAYDAKEQARALFQILNITKQLSFPRYNLFLRTWRSFQIRGFLSSKYEMPLSETDLVNITQKQFEHVLKQALAKPANMTLVKLQRRDAMLQAYNTVPRDLLRDLARFVESDCALFGYDREPSWLFDAPIRGQKYFDYFDAIQGEQWHKLS